MQVSTHEILVSWLMRRVLHWTSTCTLHHICKNQVKNIVATEEGDDGK